MSVFKCKMCGAELNISGGENTVCCEACGTEQTIEVISKELSSKLQHGLEMLEKEYWDDAENDFICVLKKHPNDTNALLGMLLVEEKCKGKSYLKDQIAPFDDNDYYKKILKSDDNELKAELEECLKTINEINERLGIKPQKNKKKDSKAAKTFSVISGILFMLGGIGFICIVLMNYRWPGNGIHLILYYLSECLLLVLGIFLFKRKQKPITVVWFLCLIGKVALLCDRFVTCDGILLPIHIIIIMVTIVLLLFMLLNIFKKNLLKHIWVQIVAFILPVAYVFCSLLGGFSIFELVNIGFCFLAMIFYLLYLISENKVRKPRI